jgi:hypothetical protein
LYLPYIAAALCIAASLHPTTLNSFLSCLQVSVSWNILLLTKESVRSI